MKISKKKNVTKYKIQPSDSLSSICECFNITLDEFMDANPELIESGYVNIPEPKSESISDSYYECGYMYDYIKKENDHA